MKPIPDRKRIVCIYVIISIQIGIMSYLRHLCLFAYSGVQHILSCGFFPLSCVPYVASCSGLSIFGCAFGIR
jgi:hypothetical protein